MFTQNLCHDSRDVRSSETVARRCDPSAIQPRNSYINSERAEFSCPRLRVVIEVIRILYFMRADRVMTEECCRGVTGALAEYWCRTYRQAMFRRWARSSRLRATRRKTTFFAVLRLEDCKPACLARSPTLKPAVKMVPWPESVEPGGRGRCRVRTRGASERDDSSAGGASARKDPDEAEDIVDQPVRALADGDVPIDPVDRGVIGIDTAIRSAATLTPFPLPPLHARYAV